MEIIQLFFLTHQAHFSENRPAVSYIKVL